MPDKAPNNATSHRVLNACEECGASAFVFQGRMLCQRHVDERRRARPRLVDLYAGAGGAGEGYRRAGFRVTGVDIHRQPNYKPGPILECDVLDLDPEWLAQNFDAAHASPPCQAYSPMHGSRGPRLIDQTRDLLEASGLSYVIENVVGAPLVKPIMLCGSMFDLDVERHRLFEANWPLPDHDWPCRHAIWGPRFPVQDHGKHYLSKVVPVYGTGGGKAAEHWEAAMQINWMTRAELAEAIPPAYTEWIGGRMLEHLAEVAA